MPTNSHRMRVYTRDDYGPADIHRDGPKAAERLLFTNVKGSKYFDQEGYTPIGYAEITLEMDSPDQMIASKVEALRAEAKKAQADHEAKQTRIKRQINELLAIPMQSAG